MNSNEFAAIVGVCISLLALFNLIKIYRKKQWPYVLATIVVSRASPLLTLDFLVSADFPGRPLLQGKKITYKSGLKPSYRPGLAYIYEVEGSAYLGTCMYSAAFVPLDMGVSRFFTTGGKYRVYYRPYQAEDSYLLISSRIPSVFFLLAGLALTSIASIIGLNEFYSYML